MADEGMHQVSAPATYQVKGRAGTGTITSINVRLAKIEEASLAVTDGPVKLSFRFFETSEPVHLEAKVSQAESGSFSVEFAGVQVVAKHMLRMIVRKLKDRPADEMSKTALMKHAS